MPHYADGTRAQVGDLVKGVSHAGPREITGKVIQISKGSTCNLAIAHINESSPVLFNMDNAKYASDAEGHSQLNWGVAVLPSVAYGDADKFAKVTPGEPPRPA